MRTKDFKSGEQHVVGMGLNFSPADNIYRCIKDNISSISNKNGKLKMLDYLGLPTEAHEYINLSSVEIHGMDDIFIFALMNTIPKGEMTNKLIKAALSFFNSWVDDGILGSKGKHNYLYKLNSISQIYDIPSCTGDILQDREGNFYLKTGNAFLFDFLDVADKIPKDVDIVVKDVRKLFDAEHAVKYASVGVHKWGSTPLLVQTAIVP